MAGFFSYIRFGTRLFNAKQTLTVNKMPKLIASVSPTALPVIDNALVKIAYTKETGAPPNAYSSTEVWFMNGDGSDQQKLSGSNNARLLNNITPAWLYYEVGGSNSSKNSIVYAYNYHTRETKNITLNGPNSGISIQSFSVSPDTTKVALTVDYTPLPCDPTCIAGDPSTYQINQSGTYLYDITTGKIKYSGGNYYFIHSWSPDGVLFYVSKSFSQKSDDGDYSVNVNTGVSTKIDTVDWTQYSNYYNFPLSLQGVSLLHFNYHNSTGGQGTGELGIQEGTIYTKLDSGDGIPACPCMNIAPDQVHIAYMKMNTLEENDSRGVIMLVDVSNKTDNTLLTPGTGEQISILGWLSDDTLLILKTTNPQRTDEGDIYSLNIGTNTLTDLSKNTEVQTYLSPQ